MAQPIASKISIKKASFQKMISGHHYSNLFYGFKSFFAQGFTDFERFFGENSGGCTDLCNRPAVFALGLEGGKAWSGKIRRLR
jgi:hypothetical protein